MKCTYQNIECPYIEYIGSTVLKRTKECSECEYENHRVRESPGCAISFATILLIITFGLLIFIGQLITKLF